MTSEDLLYEAKANIKKVMKQIWIRLIIFQNINHKYSNLSNLFKS